MKETEAMVHYIKTNAHLGAHTIAANLELKVAKVVHIAYRHRISLQRPDNKHGAKLKDKVKYPAGSKKLPKIVLPIDHPLVIQILATSNQRVLGTQYWKNRRLEVLQRDGYICTYCGQDANSVDHVIPRSAGGDHSLANLVACCLKCNGKKGNMQQHAFLTRKATPPVFLEPSLPETIRTVPDSPFNKPDTLNFDAE